MRPPSEAAGAAALALVAVLVMGCAAGAEAGGASASPSPLLVAMRRAAEGARLLRLAELRNAARAQTQARAQTNAGTSARTGGDPFENPYDVTKYLLQERANPFRSLTAFGAVNPYNPLATLVPPAGVPSADTLLPSNPYRPMWQRPNTLPHQGGPFTFYDPPPTAT